MDSGSVEEELEQFRLAWKEELKQRSGPQASGSTHAQSATVTDSDAPASTTLPRLKPLSALDYYSLAVEQERAGKLDEALSLYRTAFRRDANVNFAYEHFLSQEISKVEIQFVKPGNDAAKDGYSPVAPKPVVPLDKPATVNTRLQDVLVSFPTELAFEPENEEFTVPLTCLPDELLLRVLLLLDPTSVERFASVCRKARVLSLDTTYWRDIVRSTYIPPQISREEALENVVGEYMDDYRRVYIEHPRLRLDGVYIAVCHYVRNGLSENVWVRVNHQVTFHRYLRFLPNGRVISLLTTEEYTPQTVIPLLKPTLAMKGCYIGDWKLDEGLVLIDNLLEPGRETEARYAFQMRLELRSRPLGRWNKLEFLNYDSVELGSGEVSSFPLRNERPFWFSRVRHFVV